MKRVLVFVPGYLPGFKSGGPVRTVANMVEALGDEISFSVICLDRDMGDDRPYPLIKNYAWNQQGKAKVFYIERKTRSILNLINILRNFEFDAIHLNGFFSFQFSILPILLIKILQIKSPVILGPRGEFSQGALELKSNKKKLFISTSKLFKLHKNIIWHASSTHEADDINRVIGSSANTKISIDISKPKFDAKISKRNTNSPLKIVFISRISPKKNLHYAIKTLSNIIDQLVFDVYGPIEDVLYWENCLKLARNLPPNIQFNYLGSLQPEAVTETLSGYDLFFFPTKGENFGHVIAEALFAGLPVLISDQTPWRHLTEKGIGWDISLNEEGSFSLAIKHCLNHSIDEYHEWRNKIKIWATRNIGNQDAIDATRKLFEKN